ncbi:MAG: cell wall metabolism sensor histidine kinase WalK, partial [Defluviitaleaceae bacterium]|nr:cell wall metabolism sensor histidine kinase WalK [Defluviitaleaceae bacterium]
MSVCGSVMLFTVRASELQKAREQLRNHAQNIREQILQFYDRAGFSDGFDNFNLQNSQSDIQGGIMNDLGFFIAPQSFRALSVNNGAVISALAGEEGFVSGRRGPDLNGAEQEWLYFAMPAEKDGESFVILTRMNSLSINRNLSQLAFFIVLMVVTALALTGTIWFVFADMLTKPIIALTRSAKEMAEGRLETEIPVRSNDEIGQLTESFNHMAQELSATLADISSETNKRGAILQNMTDGVLAYDASGKLIHANTASGELLLAAEIQSVGLDAMLPQIGMEPSVISNLAPEASVESSFASGDRYVSACLTPYTNLRGEIDGYIIVLQDVTKLTKLDLMRKEFVANVSHELRTPLTSVKTYTETLLEGAVDDRETTLDFLKVIDNETQRMALLVSDLLELSRLDNKSQSLERDVVDLAGLLRLTIRQSQVIADKKGQLIKFDQPGKPYFIEVNAPRVNQVISNILTNSIKYSPEGTEIEITLEETEKNYRVFIRDNGIGIPKDDLPHVFERFYRVDKARSRQMGGTGLGLAIAKEIMEEHEGRITVTSELGKGTTMVLRFPRYRVV